jgi:hypothetical protein
MEARGRVARCIGTRWKHRGFSGEIVTITGFVKGRYLAESNEGRHKWSISPKKLDSDFIRMKQT